VLDRQGRCLLTTPFGAQVPGTIARHKPSTGSRRSCPSGDRLTPVGVGRRGRLARVRQTAPADACLPPGSPSAPWEAVPLPASGNEIERRAHVPAARTSSRSDGVPAVSAIPGEAPACERWRRITRCSRSPAPPSTTPSRGRAQPRSRSGTTVPTKGVTAVLITHVREVTASTITTAIPAVAGAAFARRHTGGIVLSVAPRSRPSA
jgi:hypothetical protein